MNLLHFVIMAIRSKPAISPQKLAHWINTDLLREVLDAIFQAVSAVEYII